VLKFDEYRNKAEMPNSIDDKVKVLGLPLPLGEGTRVR
jgi:hypothetical protein